MREDARDRGLPQPTTAREEVRVTDLARLDGIGQGPSNLVLPGNIGEGAWPIRTIERLVRHAESIAKKKRPREEGALLSLP